MVKGEIPSRTSEDGVCSSLISSSLAVPLLSPKSSDVKDASSLLGVLRVGEVPGLTSAVFLFPFTSLISFPFKTASVDDSEAGEVLSSVPFASFCHFF